VANSLNRFAVSSWMPFKTNADYAPKSDVLTGKWNPPPVVKSTAEPALPQ
jgi:hypothetical protein